MIGLIIATTGPRRPYVTIILSIPVCGVDNKKDVIDPLDAPCFFNDAETGITEHEHKGSGTPNIPALNIGKKPFFLPKCSSMVSCLTRTDNTPADINPNIRYGEIINRKFQSSIK